MTNPNSPRIVAIAVRTERNGPMREIDRATVHEGHGLEGDLPTEADRGVTLLSREQWDEVTSELGADLPWYTRRANVLVEGVEMAALLDQTVRLGEVQLQITGETQPCGLMERQHEGLRQALVPECRGGVHGRVRSRWGDCDRRRG